MPSQLVRQSKLGNSLQTLLLVVAMGVLNILIGWLLAGSTGLWMAFGMTLMGAWIAPGISPLVVLRMFKATRIDYPAAPELVAMFDDLKKRAKLSRAISLFYIPSRVPNAFAVGTREDAAVAVSDGLLRIMTYRELRGVLAHELAHIRNGDLRVMVMADSMARVTALFARIGMFMLFLGFPAFLLGGLRLEWLVAGMVMFAAPMVAMALQLALSRGREFNADLGAAELTLDPQGLSMALSRLERVSQGGFWRRIFVPDYGKSQPAWLRTHPPTEERIKKLNEIEESLRETMGLKVGEPASRVGDQSVTPRHLVLNNSRPIRSGPRWHASSGLWF